MKIIHLVRICNVLGISNWVRWLRSKIQTLSEHKLSFYRQFINKGDLCFDIGANIGQKVEIFLKLGAKVVAVEPQHSCFDFLKKIYRKNNNVMLVNMALGALPGKQEIMICESNAMSSMSSDWILKAKRIWKEQKWKKKELVRVETLDALIERFGTPKFIKIDVEGFELNVIKGLNSKVPFISFELTSMTAHQLNEICGHLKKHGGVSFNLTIDPTFAKGPINFIFNEWIKSDELSKYISKSQENIFYDVFVKFH